MISEGVRIEVTGLIPYPLLYLINDCADFRLLEGDIPYKIAFNEVDLRQKVLQAGGKWSRSTKTRKVPYYNNKISTELSAKWWLSATKIIDNYDMQKSSFNLVGTIVTPYLRKDIDLKRL
jgi:hypothetical protein